MSVLFLFSLSFLFNRTFFKRLRETVVIWQLNVFVGEAQTSKQTCVSPIKRPVDAERLISVLDTTAVHSFEADAD